jgi:hypothetical protein
MHTENGFPVTDGYELDFRTLEGIPDYFDFKNAGAVIRQEATGLWRAFGPCLRYGAKFRYPASASFPTILGDLETLELAKKVSLLYALTGDAEIAKADAT